MCTLPTERGINSPLMDLSSWIYDLKMSFYMKLGCRMFPLKPPSFDVMKKKKKKRANLRLLCYSYLLFVSPCFPFSWNPPSHMVWDAVCHLFFDARAWSKTLIWPCCTASTVSSLAELWTAADGDPRLNVQPDCTFASSCPWIEIIAPLCLSSSW